MDLTATLTSASGAAIAGQVVSFTLDGAFAGSAITDTNGVATLTTSFATTSSCRDRDGRRVRQLPRQPAQQGQQQQRTTWWSARPARQPR